MFDSLSDIHSSLLVPARFSTIAAAMLLTALIGIITGPMHGNANPFYWKVIDGLFGGIGARLDRLQRRPADLLFRGFILTAVVLSVSMLVGRVLTDVALANPLYGFTEILFLSLTMTSGTVWYGLLRLYFAVRDNKVSEGAYYTIARSSRTDLASSDNFGITRTGMGFAARSFDKGLVAPAIWYLIAGLPGAFLYAGLATLAWRFGRDGFNKGFGAVPLALEKLMGFVPTALAGLLMAFAGLFTPTGGMTRAVIALLKPEARTKYEEGGLPVTAMAHSLNVSLGGPVTDIDGRSLKREWIGPKGATAQLENGHLRRCIYISLMAFLLFLASLLCSLLYAAVLF